MVRQVQPLRISKGASSSHSNMQHQQHQQQQASPRPLSEIGSTERRRNSPSYNQAARKMIVSRENSPYTENSFTKDPNSSPHAFWRGRDPMSPSRFDDSENTPERSPSPGLVSPTRRASIERLRQAGRVKTSNIFALESKDVYDPSSTPIVERPTNARPLSQSLLNNSFTRYDSLKKENTPLRSPGRPGHKRTESETTLPSLTDLGSPIKVSLPLSPDKREGAPSPTKSSLARSSQFGSTLDHGHSTTWSADDDRAPTPRALHRHNKSVTFHNDPPIINEYEHPTPEPSVSAASGSREGSWESEDFDPEYSFERGSSADVNRDDSFDEDLENADKTPVVLPEDWSRMSPDTARTDLVDEEDDVFASSPEPQRPIIGRSESVTSDGESRPLPPLPGFLRDRRNSSLSAAAERAAQAQRNLPSPPKRASCSKDEILNMARQSSLSLEDRVKLIHANERPGSKQSDGQGVVEEMTITNQNTGEKTDVEVQETEVEDDFVVDDMANFSHSPPQISRESILRKVRKSKYDFDDEIDESEFNDDNSPARPSIEEMAMMHPDDPIPSRENSRETSDHYLGSVLQQRYSSEDVEIKEEPVDDDDIDLSTIPAIDQTSRVARSPSRMDDYDRQSSVLRHDVSPPSEVDEDSGSRYSSVSLLPEAESTVLQNCEELEQFEEDGKETLQEAMQLLSVQDYSDPKPAAEKPSISADFMGLPSYLHTVDYDFGMRDYITPSPPPSNENTKQLDLAAKVPVLEPLVQLKPSMKDLPRPTYDGAEFSPPSTPESVIHHDGSEISVLEEPIVPEETAPRDSPGIPERRATIRTNGQLKARKSATPADLTMMAEQRRLVSSEHAVPAIPQAYRADIENVSEAELEATVATMHSSESTESKADSAVEQSPDTKRRESRKLAQLNIDIPSFDVEEAGDGLGLDQEFERVIETQKKGYLMRQNTKVVVASNRNFSDESRGTTSSNENAAPMSPTAESKPGSRGRASRHNASRKPSADQYLKTEPWNGSTRRQSQRQASAAQHASGPAPPLPGQPSALGIVNEDFAAGTSSLEDEVDEGVERGRLFVKVVDVKNLDLPMPKNDTLYFQLTLDNGLHCVTTSSLRLGRTAPIGQEFELVVLNDLEFQLTLNTKLPPPPKVHTPMPASPTKTSKHQKTSSLSRFLTSPKKRAEKERQEREAVEAEERRLQEEALRKRASIQPTAWDILHELVNNSDGSFARAYVNLRAHEKQCFGRQLTVDVPCYNEWALEKDSVVVNSVRSKRGNAGPVRRPPYVVGHLELQLLYVPRPAGAQDSEMPRSMSSAIREMSRASEVKEVTHESHLSQQGGDCIHWRRRFFRLQGSRLTAYHEHTNQKRAVINLSKATRLVDDRSTLVADPKSGNPSSKSGRRKSAFAEEDEGYQYVEEGFRIRFANGETIDFYADNRAEKDAWMNVMGQVIGRPDPGKKAATWTDLVLAREQAKGGVSAEKAPLVSGITEVRDFTKPARKPSDRKTISKSVASSPMRSAAAMAAFPPERTVPAPPIADSNVRPMTPPMNARRGHRSRDAVKSMIF